MRFKKTIKRFALPEGWAWLPIQDLAKLSFSSVDKKSVEGEKPVRLCNYMDVFYNRRIREGMPFMVSTASDTDIKKFTLNQGDVVLTKDSETPEEIAFAAVIDDKIDNLVCGYHLAVLRPDKTKVTGEYLMSAINFHPNHHQFVRLANGATRFGLGVDSLNNALLPIPPLAEQRKIAEILRTWDEAIETAEAELKSKQERKRWMMDRVFAPAFGHPSLEWNKTLLGDCFSERSEAGNEGLPLLSITGGHGVVDREQIGRRDTSAADKNRYLRIRPGDIGYNTMRMWQGVCGLSKQDGIVSPAYTVLRPLSKTNPAFMYYLFKCPPMISRFHRRSQGLVNDTLNLKYPAFAKIEVNLPNPKEQLKVVQVLEAADEELRTINRHIEFLRTQKRGLMQKLLTGKVRVAA